MPRYLIERNMPGAHEMSPEELREGARKSRKVLDQLGSGIQWQHSYISEDTVTCVFIADDVDSIREHARLSGFPADLIRRVDAMMDPTTAEQQTRFVPLM